MNLLFILLTLTPSFIHIWIRRLIGNTIGSNVRIRFGTYISANRIVIEDGARIGPFSVIKGKDLKIGKNTLIKSLSLVSACDINIANNVQIAPLVIINGDKTHRSKFLIGSHSRIFPFCWIDTGEGVTIGNHVGIGGHTLIFTHGVWSNYLDGGPVTYEPVVIEDEVWLPWRVFVMPGVTIGKKTIVGANSVITKSTPENCLVAGSPAKLIKENFIVKPSIQTQHVMLQKIFNEFVLQMNSDLIRYNEDKVILKNGFISADLKDLKENNIIFIIETDDEIEINFRSKFKGFNVIYHPKKIALIDEKNKDAINFIKFLRKYGIRLDVYQY